MTVQVNLTERQIELTEHGRTYHLPPSEAKRVGALLLDCAEVLEPSPDTEAACSSS